MSFKKLSELELMALCIYGEARSQGLDGMLAVASVIQNRAKNPTWWGTDIKSVILKPQQFSCFNDGDPNISSITFIASDFQAALCSMKILRQCWWIAKGLVEEYLSSNIGNATHYHTRFVSPPWKDKLERITQIKDHIFYVEKN